MGRRRIPSRFLPAVVSFFLLLGGALYLWPRSAAGQDVSAAETAQSTAPNYRLGSDDVVQVKVFQEEDMTVTVRIAEDGYAILPLIGKVKLAGLTVAAATETIRHLLDARFIVNPQVTLNVQTYAARTFTVLGEVRKPGSYTMKDQGKIKLLEAIGLAGGFTEFANSAKILVKRASDNGHPTVTVVNGKKMARDERTSAFYLLPGDTITVLQTMF
jgi:polysaccharide biosynthesis/export protein